MRTTNTLLSLCLLLISHCLLAQANFSDFPDENQLFQRNINTNSATIKIAGSSWQQIQGIRIKVYSNNYLTEEADFSVSNNNGQYEFDAEIEIQVQLSTYKIEVYLIESWGEKLVRTANGILAGDVYLIMGQSNAVAGYGFIQDDTYLRSFDFSKWEKAPQTIGMWQISMAEKLLAEHQIPIAFINTAVSGSYISENIPGSAIFQRTLDWVNQAKVNKHIHGFLWFQGESDAGSGNDAVYYKNSYVTLNAALDQAIAQIDRKYIIQIRNGCWGDDLDASVIRQALRELVEEIPNYGIMTTQGLAHDGCHFEGQGYLDLGENLARLIGRDLYGAPDLPNIEAPNPHHAFRSGNNEIKIVTRDGRDELFWLGDAKSEFQLYNANGVYIIGGYAQKSVITLQLSGNLPQGATLTYKGHSGGYSAEPVIRNSNKVGILAFHNLEILDNIPSEICTNGIDDDGNGLMDLQELSCDCIMNPSVPCDTFDCSAILIEEVNNQIQLTNVAAPQIEVQVKNGQNQLVYDETILNPTNDLTLPNFSSGTFQVQVSALSSSDQQLCQSNTNITINSAPTGDCSDLNFDAQNGEIIIQGISSPVVFVHVFDKDWQVVYSYLDESNSTEFIIPDLSNGTYNIKVTLATSNWHTICERTVESIDLNGAGNGGNPTLDCTSIQTTPIGQTIHIENLATPNLTIQVWDHKWSNIFKCLGTECQTPNVSIPVNLPGAYNIKVEYFTAQWSKACTLEKEIHIGTALQTDTINPLDKNPGGGSAIELGISADFSIYPNPTDNYLNLQFSNEVQHIRKVCIKNSIGQSIYASSNVFNSVHSIDMTAFPKGVYWVLIETNKQFIQEKILRL